MSAPFCGWCEDREDCPNCPNCHDWHVVAFRALGLIGIAITMALLVDALHALAQVEDIAAKLLVERDEARRLLLTRVEATRLDEATLAHEYLLKEHRLALSENAGMRGVLESFIGTAEAAIRHQETKNKGGQQVPFFGDFHESTPSTAGRLRWWAKRMQEALAGNGQIPSREQQLQQALDAACLCASCKQHYEQVTGEPHKKAEVERLQKLQAIIAQFMRVRELVAEQAEDDGLWFAAKTAPEAYLMQELRRLHAVVEGKP